jgi:hypothetical protein
MKKTNLNQYLEAKYGKSVNIEILTRFSRQKDKYVEQIRK